MLGNFLLGATQLGADPATAASSGSTGVGNLLGGYLLGDPILGGDPGSGSTATTVSSGPKPLAAHAIGQSTTSGSMGTTHTGAQRVLAGTSTCTSQVVARLNGSNSMSGSINGTSSVAPTGFVRFLNGQASGTSTVTVAVTDSVLHGQTATGSSSVTVTSIIRSLALRASANGFTSLGVRLIENLFLRAPTSINVGSTIVANVLALNLLNAESDGTSSSTADITRHILHSQGILGSSIVVGQFDYIGGGHFGFVHITNSISIVGVLGKTQVLGAATSNGYATVADDLTDLVNLYTPGSAGSATVVGLLVFIDPLEGHIGGVNTNAPIFTDVFSSGTPNHYPTQTSDGYPYVNFNTSHRVFIDQNGYGTSRDADLSNPLLGISPYQQGQLYLLGSASPNDPLYHLVTPFQSGVVNSEGELTTSSVGNPNIGQNVSGIVLTGGREIGKIQTAYRYDQQNGMYVVEPDKIMTTMGDVGTPDIQYVTNPNTNSPELKTLDYNDSSLYVNVPDVRFGSTEVTFLIPQGSAGDGPIIAGEGPFLLGDVIQPNQVPDGEGYSITGEPILLPTGHPYNSTQPGFPANSGNNFYVYFQPTPDGSPVPYYDIPQGLLGEVAQYGRFKPLFTLLTDNDFEGLDFARIRLVINGSQEMFPGNKSFPLVPFYRAIYADVFIGSNGDLVADLPGYWGVPVENGTGDGYAYYVNAQRDTMSSTEWRTRCVIRRYEQNSQHTVSLSMNSDQLLVLSVDGEPWRTQRLSDYIFATMVLGYDDYSPDRVVHPSPPGARVGIDPDPVTGLYTDPGNGIQYTVVYTPDGEVQETWTPLTEIGVPDLVLNGYGFPWQTVYDFGYDIHTFTAGQSGQSSQPSGPFTNRELIPSRVAGGDYRNIALNDDLRDPTKTVPAFDPKNDFFITDPSLIDQLYPERKDTCTYGFGIRNGQQGIAKIRVLSWSVKPTTSAYSAGSLVGAGLTTVEEGALAGESDGLAIVAGTFDTGATEYFTYENLVKSDGPATYWRMGDANSGILNDSMPNPINLGAANLPNWENYIYYNGIDYDHLPKDPVTGAVTFWESQYPTYIDSVGPSQIVNDDEGSLQNDTGANHPGPNDPNPQFWLLGADPTTRNPAAWTNAAGSQIIRQDLTGRQISGTNADVYGMLGGWPFLTLPHTPAPSDLGPNKLFPETGAPTSFTFEAWCEPRKDFLGLRPEPNAWDPNWQLNPVSSTKYVSYLTDRGAVNDITYQVSYIDSSNVLPEGSFLHNSSVDADGYPIGPDFGVRSSSLYDAQHIAADGSNNDIPYMLEGGGYQLRWEDDVYGDTPGNCHVSEQVMSFQINKHFTAEEAGQVFPADPSDDTGDGINYGPHIDGNGATVQEVITQTMTFRRPIRKRKFLVSYVPLAYADFEKFSTETQNAFKRARVWQDVDGIALVGGVIFIQNGVGTIEDNFINAFVSTIAPPTGQFYTPTPDYPDPTTRPTTMKIANQDQNPPYEFIVGPDGTTEITKDYGDILKVSEIWPDTLYVRVEHRGAYIDLDDEGEETTDGHHVVFTFDGNTRRVYIDGKLCDSYNDATPGNTVQVMYNTGNIYPPQRSASSDSGDGYTVTPASYFPGVNPNNYDTGELVGYPDTIEYPYLTYWNAYFYNQGQSGVLGMNQNQVTLRSQNTEKLDEVAMYNYALSPNQIERHYMVGKLGRSRTSLHGVARNTHSTVSMNNVLQRAYPLHPGTINPYSTVEYIPLRPLNATPVGFATVVNLRTFSLNLLQVMPVPDPTNLKQKLTGPVGISTATGMMRNLRSTLGIGDFSPINGYANVFAGYFRVGPGDLDTTGTRSFIYGNSYPTGFLNDAYFIEPSHKFDSYQQLIASQPVPFYKIIPGKDDGVRLANGYSTVTVKPDLRGIAHGLVTVIGSIKSGLYGFSDGETDITGAIHLFGVHLRGKAINGQSSVSNIGFTPLYQTFIKVGSVLSGYLLLAENMSALLNTGVTLSSRIVDRIGRVTTSPAGFVIMNDRIKGDLGDTDIIVAGSLLEPVTIQIDRHLFVITPGYLALERSYQTDLDGLVAKSTYTTSPIVGAGGTSGPGIGVAAGTGVPAGIAGVGPDGGAFDVDSLGSLVVVRGSRTFFV